ncbi:GMC family oxidoreductase [Novosphingobium resinovorum]|uniref:Choline dehydrogenase n=1 Tax=Novosphingobium resinovorum TaxID=158500 RepID=A0A031JY13_9SPHN|nr:GMC family oxidoreductase N-terminal domain-containing protein [Novosphingobium resinovorum]AOR80166.1 glucose-methanol-choline oxidoreductase [Novosphingobium resinovorum]EZP81267.1 Choline dehydrogenase [Novosphingobium resinovorum]
MTVCAQWDYVIIGAGSAGSVLSERLSRNPAHRVLLVEAGGENASLLVDMPKGIAKLVNSPEHIWAYQMADRRYPESQVPEVWIRGRGLGGSSAINGMIWSRGEAHDYDDWAAMGCTGWNAATMTEAYRALEDHALGGSDLRGAGGPVRITPGDIRYPLTDAIIAAGKAMGLTETEDLNATPGDRIGYYSHNIRRGRRESGGRVFVSQARKRKNFEHRLHTLARRVIIENGRVTGVELQRDGRPPWVEQVRGEVIVCCGTIESPLLLERSGIGSGARLKAAGLAPLVESPAVGEKMREHLSYAMPYRMTKPAGISQRYHGIGLVGSVLRYVFSRSGVMANGPWEVGAFCNVAHPQGRTDLQLYLGGYAFALSEDNHPVPLGKVDRQPGISVYGQLLQLTSEGSVHAASPNPQGRPVIHANWLDTEYDRKAAIASVRYMRRFMAQPALSGVMGAELLPGEHVQSDDAILESFRRLSTSGLHGTGTCHMGGDAGSVVDPQLRVRGVVGLRVADCSIMPALVSGNTNAPAMAVGWRAADILLAQ